MVPGLNADIEERERESDSASHHVTSRLTSHARPGNGVRQVRDGMMPPLEEERLNKGPHLLIGRWLLQLNCGLVPWVMVLLIAAHWLSHWAGGRAPFYNSD